MRAVGASAGKAGSCGEHSTFVTSRLEKTLTSDSSNASSCPTRAAASKLPGFGYCCPPLAPPDGSRRPPSPINQSSTRHLCCQNAAHLACALMSFNCTNKPVRRQSKCMIHF